MHQQMIVNRSCGDFRPHFPIRPARIAPLPSQIIDMFIKAPYFRTRNVAMQRAQSAFLMNGHTISRQRFRLFGVYRKSTLR